MQAHLEQLEEFLKYHVLHPKSNLAELKMQLCISISKLPISDAAKLAKFQGFLTPNRTTVDCTFAKHVLRLIAAEQPQLLGLLIKEDSALLLRFFQALPMVQRWFDGFERCTKHGVVARGGATALRHFLFTNRENEWDKIAWRGGVGYTPPTVAARPQLLVQMDAVKTACTLLEDPKFVCSQSFQSAVAEGSIIALDPDFFIEALLEDLASQQPVEDSLVLATIASFIRGCSFAHLLMTLYPVFSDHQLVQLLQWLLTDDQRGELMAASWENIVLLGCRWRDLDELLLFHALATSGLKEVVADESLQLELDSILQDYNPHRTQKDQQEDLECFVALHRQLHAHRIGVAEVKFALLCSFRLFYCLKVHLNDDVALTAITQRHHLPLHPVHGAVDVDLLEDSGENPSEQEQRESEKRRKKARRKRKRERRKAKKERKRRKSLGYISSSSSSTSSVGSDQPEEEFDPQDPMARLHTSDPVITGWKVDGPPTRQRSLLHNMTGGLSVGSTALPALLTDLFRTEYLLALQRDLYDIMERGPKMAPKRQRGLRMDAEVQQAVVDPPVNTGPREWDVGKEEQWSSGEEWDRGH
eukprot:GGOE01040673.1.p1 GENE.GGOE01040673.1~~GGOE01040673.1.p1  ORF type:complete len:619 (-),score=131.73 GGOE01040673.1:233-1990(-)